jgi:hypothetical protein
LKAATAAVDALENVHQQLDPKGVLLPELQGRESLNLGKTQTTTA